jgi:penicillin-binding protein 1A
MALPIWGIFMKKVYADKSLGYSESDIFPYASQNVCGNDSTAVGPPGGMDSLFAQ